MITYREDDIIKQNVNVTSHGLPSLGSSSGLYIGMTDGRIGLCVIEKIFKGKKSKKKWS